MHDVDICAREEGGRRSGRGQDFDLGELADLALVASLQIEDDIRAQARPPKTQLDMVYDGAKTFMSKAVVRLEKNAGAVGAENHQLVGRVSGILPPQAVVKHKELRGCSDESLEVSVGDGGCQESLLFPFVYALPDMIVTAYVTIAQ